MTAHDRFLTLDALDSILLDVATQIEPSAADGRIADNRYRKLQEHLERPSSVLAIYLKNGSGLIYAQGSMATSTTILSGIDDDRFDVDAIVELDVPKQWSEHDTLDKLETSLQGFPGAVKIVRCTRCIQIQFPFMHMDVTIMDRSRRLPISRAGEIIHAPDIGHGARIPSNPWGFTAWFRGSMSVDQQTFADELRKRRGVQSKSRLRALDEREEMLAKAEQVDLPPMIPSRLDAQEAVALKLLKRYVYRRYEKLTLKQPPSIYLAKRAASIGYVPQGLAAQLILLSESTAEIMRGHIASGTRPEETNPSYHLDKINDRWPAVGAEAVHDMRSFAECLEHLSTKLRRLARAPLNEIVEVMSELFGERVSTEVRSILKNRFDTRAGTSANLVQAATGNVAAPAIVRVSNDVRPVPKHNFHSLIIESEDDN